VKKCRIHESDLNTAGIGREPLMVAPSTPIDTISFSNMIKRE
jgi:hypothetical protein